MKQPKKGAKAAFVRTLPRGMPIAEVVARGANLGISVADVYYARRNMPKSAPTKGTPKLRVKGMGARKTEAAANGANGKTNGHANGSNGHAVQEVTHTAVHRDDLALDFGHAVRRSKEQQFAELALDLGIDHARALLDMLAISRRALESQAVRAVDSLT